MKILGIDTILHDVCAAVVENGRLVLSNVAEHTIMDSGKLYQLVDLHLNQICSAIRKAIKKAKCRPEEISLISVNNFGSFFSNTLIGVVAAKTLAEIFGKPLITIHHQEAHYFSNWLERGPEDFKFPVLVLSSSGGHSSIVKILDGKFNFKKLFTIDAMRKKSRNLPDFTGIGAMYSYVANALKIGGPISSASVLFKYAKKGDKRRFDFYKQIARSFNIAKLDFSVMQKLINQTISGEMNKNRHLSRKFICDIAASFEDSMARLIAAGLIELAAKEKAEEIHLVGGISANDTLRDVIKNECLKNGFGFKYPKKKSYCTDNAAMIASLGYYKYCLLPIKQRKRLLTRKIKIDSNLKLEEIALNQRKNAY